MDMEQQEPPVRSANHIGGSTISSILEVTSEFLYAQNLDTLLQKIVKTVSETFGLRAASIGIRDRESGVFVVRACYGFSPQVEQRIRNVKYTMERMTKDLRPEFKIGRNIYYVPGEAYEIDNEDDMLFVLHPERIDQPRRFPNEWHELDYIDFLMYERDGSLLGFLEIDEPDDHKVPDDETLRAIEVFSDLAAIAIQNAELYQRLDEDRKKIELLVDLIAHDVNNYAQAVSGFIELAMARKGVPEPSRKSLTKALDQIWNLNKLIANVKLFAKVESAGGKDLRPTDVIGAIREAFASAASCYPTREIRLDLRHEGPTVLVMANDFLREVFLNLFTNALKFDTRESMEVEVTIQEFSSEGREMVCVSVADRGPGVPDELKGVIFDRFALHGQSLSQGTGLGLHIAKTLVQHYKGKIWVEDRVKGDRSKGSIFKVLLPKAQAGH